MQAPRRKFELLRPMRHLVGVTGSDRTDEELVRAAWQGDVAALGALLERHRAAMYATVLAVLSDPSEAHDAVQDAFLVALARLQEIREPAAVAGWLRVVVRNNCLMRVRGRREAPTDTFTSLPDGDPDGAEALDRMVMADWVWKAIDTLPEDQAVAVILRYFARHATYQEISTLLGVPIGTVRSRLSQARHRLGEELLRTAERSHTDHQALVDERAGWWRAAVEELHQRGVGELYASGCAPDVLVEERTSGYRERGIEDQRRGAEDSVAAGVRMQVTDIWASNSVTIIEGNYRNPPHDPQHCPATHTEVRIHPQGETSRLLLYYRPHADAAPAG